MKEFAQLILSRRLSQFPQVSILPQNTIVKLLADLGAACSEYQNKVMHGLKLSKVQCDEIWSFCYSKQKNVPDEFEGVFGFGDVWTWTAIDSETKLVPCWHVGLRTPDDARAFIDDLASRLVGISQITTDGLKIYASAIRESFGEMVDYAMLVKMYGPTPEAPGRYSPANCTGIKKTAVIGDPDMKHVSTSFVERQNLTMRMGMRRFTRLTNGFSKKIENHEAAIALHFMYYNFARIHQTLRITPAMAAGVSDHLWEVEEIVALLDGNSN